MNERKQSGVVPYKYEDGKLYILLIKKKGGEWGFPKGGLTKGLTPTQNAAKEAKEEAGIIGDISTFLGVTRYQKKGVPQSVQWYMMHVTKEKKHYDEEDVRKRKWFKVDKALDKVDSTWVGILNLALIRLR